MKCKIHGILTKDQVGERKNGKYTQIFCKICKVEKQKERRKRDADIQKEKRYSLKRELIDMKGGKCIACGYDRYIGALDFHHLNENEKIYNVGTLISGGSRLKAIVEIQKCILLCSNCHRELHGDYC